MSGIRKEPAVARSCRDWGWPVTKLGHSHADPNRIRSYALQAEGVQLILTGPLTGVYDPNGMGSMLFAVLAVAAQLDEDAGEPLTPPCDPLTVGQLVGVEQHGIGCGGRARNWKVAIDRAQGGGSGDNVAVQQG